MRRFLKFLHTAAALGLAGGLAAYLMVLLAAPADADLNTRLALRESLAFVASWLIMPSMLVVLASGLLAMAAHYPFVNAPWVWVKAISGLLIFEATLASVDAPAQQAVEALNRAVAGLVTEADLARLVRNEWGAWWMLLALSLANVALGIWRPRFGLPRG